MVLKGKELEDEYKKKYPDERRGFVDIALFNLIFEEMGRKLLDVGCGFGEMLSALEASNFEVRGMTATHYEVNACRKKGLDVVEGNASKKFPFEPGEFESVIMLDSIEHFEDYENSIRESYRVLREGGKIFIYTPNREVFRKSKKFEEGHCHTHFREFDLTELRQILQKNNFKNVRFFNKRFYYPRYFFLRFLNPLLPKGNLGYLCAIAGK